MRSNIDPAKQVVYLAAQAFVHAALLSDGSMFEPDRQVWSSSVLDDLHARFNLVPDETADSFEDKLRRQLEGAPVATIQLAAELVYFHFLVARDIGGPAKRRLVDVIISWSADPIAIPDNLEKAFSTGVCNTGVAFKTFRPFLLWFLIDLMREWKAKGEPERSELLQDPWEFKRFVESVPQKAAYTQRQALQHLVFPAVFEDMVSRAHKALIIQAFAADVGTALPPDADRALTVIRSHLAADHGDQFSFYDPPFVERWRATSGTEGRPTGLDELSRKAWLLRGTSDKVSLVPDWLTGGYCSIGWAELGEVPVDISRAALSERLVTAYPDDSPGTVRNSAGVILRFLRSVSEGDILLAPNEGDLYVGIVDGEVEYRPTGVYAWRRAVEWANPDAPIQRSSVSPSLYSKMRTLLTLTDITEDIAELVAHLEPPRPNGTVPPTETQLDAVLPPATPELAEELHLPLAWLDRQIDLLRRKRQLIFYGPPGTGKTFVAQALADHLTGDPSASALVQFHPSYSYEDFFEGFRPRPTESGMVGFELVSGPLRRLADAAALDRTIPHVLIIDEINRANVAKVFGEMYFLLEYRDRAVSLQYSGEKPFQLPRNLYIIATMNTVDRSIALVDAAMRRRFYFTPLLPDRSPVDRLLRDWLQANRLPSESADLLAELNRRIQDPELAIGPSYFMAKDIGDPAVIRLIWEHSILPQLEEHHFGTNVDVQDRYNLESVRRSVARRTDTSAGGDTQPSS